MTNANQTKAITVQGRTYKVHAHSYKYGRDHFQTYGPKGALYLIHVSEEMTEVRSIMGRRSTFQMTEDVKFN